MTNTIQAPLVATAKVVATVKVKYCLYVKKSTEQEDKQVLSIDSQIREMEKLALNDGLEIVTRKQESHSAKGQANGLSSMRSSRRLSRKSLMGFSSGRRIVSVETPVTSAESLTLWIRAC